MQWRSSRSNQVIQAQRALNRPALYATLFASEGNLWGFAMSTLLSPPAVTHSPMRRRKWLRWAGILGTPAALFLGSVVVWWALSTIELSSANALADRLDPGWRLEELEARRRPAPPAGENGIDQVMAIWRALGSRKQPEWSFPEYQDQPAKLRAVEIAMWRTLNGGHIKPTLLNDEQLRVLRTENKRTSEALALAREMVKYFWGRFPITYTNDFFSTDSSHIEAARATVDLLRYDAMLRAHDGDMAGAFQNIKAAICTSRSIGDEPILYSQLMRLGISLTELATLERVLGLGEASDRDLRDIQDCLTEESARTFLLIGARGERAGLDRWLRSVASGETTFAQFSSRIMNGRPPDTWDQIYLWKIYLNMPAYRAKTLVLATEFVELCKLPPEQQRLALMEWIAGVSSAMPSKVEQTLLLDAASNVSFSLGAIALLRASAAGVAAERFRLAEGRWPAELAELVPKYLTGVPADPYDGQPLRFKRTGGKFVVYSLLPDGLDCDGDLGEGYYHSGPDTGFQLFDPALRRQPAEPFVFPPKTPE